MGLFLAGGSAYTRRQGLRRLKQRLENVPGASNVRDEPSAIKPTTVVVDVDIEMFLEEPFPRDTGRLEVVYRPREETDLQRVQWIDDAVGLGWHKDRAHPDLGTTQFQCETGDGATPRRDPAHIEVEAPVSFPESCLDRLPDRIRETGGWSGVRGVGVRLLSERASRSENRTHHTHIRGHQGTVRDVEGFVYRRTLASAAIADRFELPETAVHKALVSYRLNPEYVAGPNASPGIHTEARRTPTSDRRI